MSEPIFHFKSYNIKSLNYSENPIEDIESSDINDLKFKVNHGFTKDLKSGKLELSIALVSNEEDKHLHLTVEGFFELNESLFKDENGQDRTPDVVNEIFVTNSVAIIYPYLRSIVSIISSLDNASNIILPTLNLRNFGRVDE